MTGEELYEQSVSRIQAVRMTEGKAPLAWLVPWGELLDGERVDYDRMAARASGQGLNAWEMAVELTRGR